MFRFAALRNEYLDVRDTISLSLNPAEMIDKVVRKHEYYNSESNKFAETLSKKRGGKVSEYEIALDPHVCFRILKKQGAIEEVHMFVPKNRRKIWNAIKELIHIIPIQDYEKQEGMYEEQNNQDKIQVLKGPLKCKRDEVVFKLCHDAMRMKYPTPHEVLEVLHKTNAELYAQVMSLKI